MDKYIGTCSICDGAVTVPFAWFGMQPPVPTCQRCGATATSPYGPKIEMSPKTIKHRDRIPVQDW